jgi:hypothetical protein
MMYVIWDRLWKKISDSVDVHPRWSNRMIEDAGVKP